ncbi:MAG TPA: protein phosphatase 2C domain-containing protein [Sandaracinaceae bacterium LLY-WYZ-13_1]|nr:protein phosphatase 2C domain-containing protein [Sandaracinaceae bacterium LLY-WYZ-13_1]
MGDRARDDATQQIETLGSPSTDDNRQVEGLGPPAIHPDVFGLTDVGEVRTHNEDSFLVAQLERSMRLYQSSRPVNDGAKVKGPPQGWLFIVADGMGGHAAGEVASAMTIDSLARYAFTLMPWSLPRDKDDSRILARGLRDAVTKVQRDMKQAAQTGTGRAGMGTTLTMAYVAWPNLFVVHVGDSRMYAFREGQLHQVTHDHTLAQQLVDSKIMSADEAEESEFSNILVNALGGDSDDLRVELHHAMLFPGDVVLLCSDGLTKHVTDADLTAKLGEVSAGGSVETAARELVGQAKADGGTDNVTVVVARF